MNAPNAQKKTNPLLIVLAVIGTLAVIGIGTCTVGAFFLAREVKTQMGDGGSMVLTAPPEVVAELAGKKKDYVGSWSSARGSSLDIRPDGTLTLAKREGGSTTNVNGPIAAFRGDDMELKVFVTIPVRVSVAPHLVGAEWQMTAEGIAFVRK